MAKKRIVVMYGGKADEHSISCISAASALRALDTDKFEAIPVGITKDGKWIVNGENPLGWSLDEGLPTVEKTPGAKDVVLEVALGQDGFFAREDDGTMTPFGHVDAVFPVLHGPYGEDGTIQGLFEMMGVPYVGCGVLASAACMDKHYTKVLLAAAGIPVAPGITLDARSFDKASEFKTDADAIMAQVSEAGLQYPLFVKPSRAGSSFGVTKVEHEGDAAELAAAVYEASRHRASTRAKSNAQYCVRRLAKRRRPAGRAKSYSTSAPKATTSSTTSTASTWTPPQATWKCPPICRKRR